MLVDELVTWRFRFDVERVSRACEEKTVALAPELSIETSGSFGEFAGKSRFVKVFDPVAGGPSSDISVNGETARLAAIPTVSKSKMKKEKSPNRS